MDKKIWPKIFEGYFMLNIDSKYEISTLQITINELEISEVKDVYLKSTDATLSLNGSFSCNIPFLRINLDVNNKDLISKNIDGKYNSAKRGFVYSFECKIDIGILINNATNMLTFKAI